MGMLPPWQTHKETSLNKNISLILRGCIQLQYNTAGDRSFLGVPRHLDVETQSSQGQSKVGVILDWDPSGCLQLLKIQRTTHLSFQPRPPPCPPHSIHANEASFVGSVRPENWEIPKGNSLQKHSASFDVYSSLKIINPA